MTRARDFAMFAAVVAGLAPVISGCAGSVPVDRLVDGHPIATRFIDVDAYDAYLRGALAEASGHKDEAIAAYEQAAADDPTAPDIWTNIGVLRCRFDVMDRKADAAFARAIRADEAYAPAYLARSLCEGRRGDAAASADDLHKARSIDPRTTPRDPASSYAPTDEARARLAAETEKAPRSVEPWRALARWGTAKNDPILVAQAYERALAICPTVRGEAAFAAEKLAEDGHQDQARHLAGVVADAVDDPTNGRRDPLPAPASRLAVDDAILRGDAALLDRRLVETRTPDLAAASRAIALQRPELAARLTARRRAADGI